MKIGLITDNLDLQSAGIGSYARNLSNALLDYDKDNSYIFFHNRKNDFYKGKSEVIIPQKKSFFNYLFRRSVLFPRKVNPLGLDLIHDTYHFMPFRLNKNIKKVVTVHDIYSLLNPKNHRFVSTFAHLLFLKRILRRCDKIIAISNNTKKDIIRKFRIDESKIAVVPESVDEDYTVIKDRKELETVRKKYKLPKKFILHVGTLEPRKNLPFLLRAYHSFKTKTHSDAKIVLVGKKGWKSQEIFDTIKKYKLEKDIVLPGYVDREDLPAMYNLAEIFVYPSLYEGFGLPPLEAMNCGTPVITSNTSSIPEVVGNSAIKINPLIQKNLTDALVKVSSDPKFRKTLISKGLRQAKKFSWEKTARETLKVYGELLK